MTTFPEPPEHLKEPGRVAWNSGQTLWEENGLQERDLSNWRLYAEAWDAKQRYEDEIRDHGGEFYTMTNGSIAAHPAVKLRKEAEDIIRKYSTLYGLVPEARNKRQPASQGVKGRPRD